MPSSIFDEAQYWAWAQEPAFGYFSKPPLLAWIIARKHLAVRRQPVRRAPAVAVDAFATSFVIYAIAARLYGPRVGFWAALLYAIMPGTSISATLMSTDVPLLLLWSIALLALIHHVEQPSLGAGLRIGLAVGLGLNAKYAMIYFVLCYAVHAAISPQARASLRHPGTWAGLGLALAPDRAEHLVERRASFRDLRAHARERRLERQFPQFLGLLAFIGTQIAITSPVPAAAFGARHARPPGGRLAGDRAGFLLAMSLPVFLLICGQALISKANGNWAAPGFVAAAVLAAAVMVALDWRRGMIFTLRLLRRRAGRHQLCRLVCRRDHGPARSAASSARWSAGAISRRRCARSPRPTGSRPSSSSGRGMTASMLYELRESHLDIRSYVEDGKAPADHFEMTQAMASGRRRPGSARLYRRRRRRRATLAKRATLVEQFRTEIFVTKGFGWTARA